MDAQHSHIASSKKYAGLTSPIMSIKPGHLQKQPQNVGGSDYFATLARVEDVIKDVMTGSLERPVAFTMSLRDYYRMLEDLNYGEFQRWPRFSYDASKSRMIIQCMPSPLHNCITDMFRLKLAEVMVDVPRSFRSRISHATFEVNGFKGAYRGSAKSPDLAILFDNEDGEPEVKLVFEIGFSENYADLIQGARKWLEGKESVTTVVLISIKETPVYRNPVRDLSEREIRDNYPLATAINAMSFIMQGGYGPAVLGEHCWVGRIESVSAEIWKRDPENRLARRFDRMELLPSAAFSLKLSDCIGVQTEYERTITLSADDLRFGIARAIRMFALFRYQKAVTDPFELSDDDYEPRYVR